MDVLGDKTASVEALPSYFHRCAYAHGVSTKKYLIHVINCSDIDTDKSHAYACKLLEIRGCGHTFFEKVANFYKDTFDINLFSSTFTSAFSGLHASNSNEVRSRMRWCPECYQEALSSGEDAYVKLIWYLDDLTHCNVHALPLLERCSLCGKLQNVIGRKLPLHICSFCSASLTVRSDTGSLKPLFSWMAQGADLIEYMVEIFRRGAHSPIGVDKSIYELTTCFLNDEFYQAFRYCWSNRDVRYQLWGKYGGMNLRSLRIICKMCNITLYDFMSGNFLQGTRQLPWKREIPHPYATPSKTALYAHTYHYESLIDLIQRPGITLEEISALMAVSEAYLNTRFPSLCNLVKKNHEEFEIKKMYQERLTILERSR